MSTHRRGRAVPAAVLVLAVTLGGCSSTGDLGRASGEPSPRTGTTPSPVAPTGPSLDPSGGSSASGPSGPTAGPSSTTSFAVPDPGPLTGRLRTSDVLLTSARALPARVRRAVAAVRGVDATVPLSVASLSVDGRTLSIAAADPARLRRFTAVRHPPASDEVWRRVAGGEVAVDPSLAARLADRPGYLRLGVGRGRARVHIGAYAPAGPAERHRVAPLSGWSTTSAATSSACPSATRCWSPPARSPPSAVTGRLKKVLGPGTTCRPWPWSSTTRRGTAVLSGASVSERGRHLHLHPAPRRDGHPDPALGARPTSAARRCRSSAPSPATRACCRSCAAALEEVVASGLAAADPPRRVRRLLRAALHRQRPGPGSVAALLGDRGGPQRPRQPARHRRAEMDRRVVAIFKRWGFAWGGDWNYTDPMHFEMAGSSGPAEARRARLRPGCGGPRPGGRPRPA